MINKYQTAHFDFSCLIPISTLLLQDGIVVLMITLLEILQISSKVFPQARFFGSLYPFV